jgi:lipopolysaccharide/colanic/teichoic acid biosynthesis glycosyltransferase
VGNANRPDASLPVGAELIGPLPFAPAHGSEAGVVKGDGRGPFRAPYGRLCRLRLDYSLLTPVKSLTIAADYPPSEGVADLCRAKGDMSEIDAHRPRREGRQFWVRHGFKRSTDLALASVMLVLTLPILSLLACAVWVDTGFPVIFRARRIGRQGRIYTMYKLRTMTLDATQRLSELSHLNIADGMVKIPNDPRVTPVGTWLRRYSLDELPQLWNIIKGDMSLVGPRPHDESEVSLNTDDLRVRFSVRPGLTGLWQVKARNDPSMNHRVQYDLDYLGRASPILDLRILFWTVPAVLRGQGGSVIREPVIKHNVVEHPISRNGLDESSFGYEHQFIPPAAEYSDA